MSPQARRIASAPDEATVSMPERAIVTRRLLDAPRDLVFRVWTEPEHVTQWWGPNGFSTTIHEMDVRPGGVWRLTMHGPDGRDYHNKIVFIEIAPPERLVFRHVRDRDTEPVTHKTIVTFTDLGRRTEVTFRLEFDSNDVRDLVIKTYGAAEGGKQTLGRLADYVVEIGGSAPR